MCGRKSLNSLNQAYVIRNEAGVNIRLRDFNTRTEIKKMQASEIEQLDNKSLKYILLCSITECFTFLLVCGSLQRRNVKLNNLIFSSKSNNERYS